MAHTCSTCKLKFNKPSQAKCGRCSPQIVKIAPLPKAAPAPVSLTQTPVQGVNK